MPSSTAHRNNGEGPPRGRRNPEAYNTCTGHGSGNCYMPPSHVRGLLNDHPCAMSSSSSVAYALLPLPAESTQAHVAPHESKAWGGGGEGLILKVPAVRSVALVGAGSSARLPLLPPPGKSRPSSRWPAVHPTAGSLLKRLRTHSSAASGGSSATSRPPVPFS